MAHSSEPLSSTNHFDNSRIFPKKRKHLVGLLNQGGTCYLNSLLQTLFHTPEFTYRLFNLTTTSNLGALKSIIREMLRLFYCLMTYKKFAISSKSLTDSFGWNDQQVFVHQDVQELNRLLFEEIEFSLKSSVEANLITDLYKGIISTKIQCLRCGYRSEREDEYLDVNLAVIEHDSVERCLQAQTSIERLDGENQYFCEKCNRKVDAVKATHFKEYPPILTLCLSRFDFDPNTMESIKVDKCCSFPLILDVSNFMEVRQKKKILYDLFSVVIHIGNSTLGGHYHAYIKDPYGYEKDVEGNENNKRESTSVYLIDKENAMVQCERSTFNESENTTESHVEDAFENESLSQISDESHSAANLTMVQQSTNTTCGMQTNSHSPSSVTKKSPNKFSSLFEAIRNFWSGSNPVPGTLSDQLISSTDMDEFDHSIPQITSQTVTIKDHDSFFDYKKSSSDDFPIDFSNPINSNNNETVESWKSQIFCSKTKDDNFLNTGEGDYDKSHPKSDSKSSNTRTTDSRGLSNIPNKMTFQSDTQNPNKNDPERLDKKMTKSDSMDKHKFKTTFIESGRWFDFNDETITEIDPQDFQKVYQGQECAYMLFYRTKDLVPPG